MENKNAPSNNRTCIIVRSDYLLLRITQHALEKMGYEVKAFTDGNQAKTAIASMKPELLILDEELTGSNAWELCRFVRNRLKQNSMIVVSSVLPTEETVHRAVVYQVEELIQRRFDKISFSFLVQKLEMKLGYARLRSQSKSA